MEWHVLSKLECRGPTLLQQTLSEWVGIDNAQLTRVLNKLEEKKMIKRTIDPSNRRIRHVSLTDPNADYLRAMVSCNRDIHDAIMAALSATEQRQLLDLLKKVGQVTSVFAEQHYYREGS